MPGHFWLLIRIKNIFLPLRWNFGVQVTPESLFKLIRIRNNTLLVYDKLQPARH